MSSPITPAEFAAYTNLKRAIVTVRLNLGRRLRALGGPTLVQFEILNLLEQSPDGLRMHELADAVGASRSGLSYQVGLLEDEGLVERITSPTNSRAVFATLTDDGVEHVKRLQDAHFQFMRDHAFGLLTEQELTFMTSIFQRIADETTEKAD